MGEIAEMMLDGTLCEGCGVYIGRGSQGYPGYCSRRCAENRGAVLPRAPTKRQRNFGCHCKRRFNSAEALAQHQRDKHSKVETNEVAK